MNMWDDEYTNGWEDIMDNPYLGTGTDYDFYEDELGEYRDELDALGEYDD